MKDYRARNRERIRHQNRARYEANRGELIEKAKIRAKKRYVEKCEEIKEKVRLYAATHPEVRQARAARTRDKINRRQRDYYANHPEAHRKYQQTQQQRHGEKLRAKARNYYKLNKIKIIERVKGHVSEHPEEYRAYQQVYQSGRRALKKSLPATLTTSQWEAIKVTYDYCCAYCGKRSHRLTQDHVIPITQGGGTTPDNIVPACKSCNSSKGNRSPANLPTIRLLL